MTRCSRCNAVTITCSTCGRTVKERGVSGMIPADALPPGSPGGPSEPCQVASHCLEFNHNLLHSNSLDHSNNLDHNHSNKELLDSYTGPSSNGGIISGFYFEDGILYWESYEDCYVWIPDGKDLYYDDQTGELILE